MKSRTAKFKKQMGRDPIREAPLRDPGESLREQILDRIFEQLGPWITTAAVTIALAAIEWMRWAVNARPSPLLMSCLAVGITVLAFWKSRKALAEIKRLKLGLRGERMVGQLLQAELLPRGYTIIHDVCMDDFNVDHALIGPGGVFAIEVKTRTKPDRGEVRITYDGKQILVNGFAPDRDPVTQAQAGAQRLEEILLNFAGRPAAVRPVVIFPSWWVDPQPPGVHVWVLNEKAFIQFIDHERAKLTPADIRVYSEALARYVRGQLED